VRKPIFLRFASLDSSGEAFVLTKVEKYVIITVGRNARRSYLKMVAVGFLNPEEV
jgi:hypothetical protein